MQATLAVVLARGLGTRFRADDGSTLTEAQRTAAARGAKGLTPFHGRPLMDFVLHELAEGGVRDVVMVVAPDDELIRARYDDGEVASRIRVRFAVQAEPLGTADALLAARGAVEAPAGAARDDSGARHFIVCNSDNLYPAASVVALTALDGPGLVAYDATSLYAEDAEGTTRGRGGLPLLAERVRRFALLDVGEDDVLRDIVEKPSASHPLVTAELRWVSMNLWRFTDSIFADCAAVSLSARGEFELVDAVRRAIGRGERFAAVRQRVAVPDLSHRRDVAALELLLAGRTPRP